MKSYSKIWHLGHKQIADILKGEVEITEKLDGSQIGFGRSPEGELLIRSKGAIIDQDNPQKLFIPAVEQILSISSRIAPDSFFYGEAICTPRHNTLKYDRTPVGFISLFGAGDFDFYRVIDKWLDLSCIAQNFGMEVVPKLYSGVATLDTVTELLDRESHLGGTPIEGVVVKNYAHPYELYGQHVPVMVGKFVTEQFKEKHKVNDNFASGKSKMEMYFDSFNTVARWEKAIQHLRDSDLLEDEPKDIGILMRELHRDLEEECKEEIKDKLWELYRKDVLGRVSRGFPQFYKERVLNNLK